MMNAADTLHTNDPAHSAAWRRCCAALEAELDRQRRVLDLCKEQGRAARARDIESLETATRELVEVMEDVIEAEHVRHAAVRAVVDAHALNPEAQNLSGLIDLAPEPWHERLKQCQIDFKNVMHATQSVVRANRRFMRYGARSAERLLTELFGREEQAGAYTSDGAERGSAPSEAALLNTAG